jgi:long-chain fatty acid transport protein
VRRYSTIFAVVACLALIGAEAAYGAGFEVQELSTRSLGNANAGKAAAGEDAAIAFFNPAGMTLFKQMTLSVPVQALNTTGEFKNNGSSYVAGGGIGGGDGGDPGGLSIIPSIYFIAPVMEDLAVGLSINSPFGLKTDYDSGWMGRYHALESDLKTYNVNAAVAYRFDEVFSVGAGVSWQYATATLSNAIDFGTIGFAQLGPGAGKLGLVPQGSDGEVELEGDSYGWGFNVGVLIEFSESTRLGIAYRSSVFHKIEGDTKFRVPSEASVLKGGGAFKNTDGEARLRLPPQAYVSFYTEITDEWAILADVTWTGWSSFEELNIRFDNRAQPTATTVYKWQDVMRYSIGANWKPLEGWTFRIGTAYDESPIPDSTRTPRIPTGDRYWAALGASWQISDMFSVDLSYAHIFIQNGRIDQTTSTGQRLKGTFEGSADILALQVNVAF